MRFLAAALLLASALSVDCVTLAWDPSVDLSVVGYNIYYGVGSRTYTNFVDVGYASFVSITNLVPGVTYFFTATCYDGLGMESAYSGEVSYTPPADGAFQLPLLSGRLENGSVITATIPTSP